MIVRRERQPRSEIRYLSIDCTSTQSARAMAVNAAAYPIIEVTSEPDDGDPGTSGKEILVGDLRNL